MLCAECRSITFVQEGRNICPTCCCEVEVIEEPKIEQRYCDNCEASTLQCLEDGRWMCMECNVEEEEYDE
jgi:uncharacterized Zn finger protein (UPF0148 family)